MPLIALINPEITPVGRAMVEGWEGCLSIPDIRGRVPARRVASASRRTIATAPRVELVAQGLPARVIQHETDHLDGVLFFDRMTVVRVADLHGRVPPLLDARTTRLT